MPKLSSEAPPKPKSAEIKPVTPSKENLPDYNGQKCEKYVWTQTVEDVTINVIVPQNVETKDIICTINRQSIALSLKSDSTPILKGEFPGPVDVELSVWSYDKSSSTITVSLEKKKCFWWKSVVEGDPEIDTTKVDSTKKIGDYDDETQATIHKMMFDKRQQEQGLPTSDELIKERILEKAKNLPGSPFLNQET